MNKGFRRLLIFTLREERYALDLGKVAEVMEPPPSFPVPRAPHYITGIINFHGALVALLDLAGFFTTGAAMPGGKILVLHRTIANLAFQVDTVENIVSEEVVLEESESADPLIARLLVMADGEISELAVEKILERLESVFDGQSWRPDGT